MDKWIYNPYLNALEPGKEILKLPVVSPKPLQLYPIPTPITSLTLPTAYQLDSVECLHRIETMVPAIRAEADIAKQWLTYRHSSERNIRIDYQAESKERYYYGRGEQFSATLKVNIW
jgi:hypothetical protein